MPVSKRLRYEILKRDNHTCRYCGQSAPDVKLAVDHVTPTALGGTDLPDNLVAACADCNSGKASTSPTAALVADVRADALRHAELVRQAYAVLLDHMGERDDYLHEFESAFTHHLPQGWRESVGRWFKMGVPILLVTAAASIACGSSKSFNQADSRFRYMCGIVWGQIQMVDETASERAAIDGSFMDSEALSERDIANYLTGRESEARDALRYDPLSMVVDRIYVPTEWVA